MVAAPLAAQQPGGQQQPPSTTQMVLKGKAPVSNELLKVTLPKAKEATLPNGLRLMVLEDHRVPQVTFQLMIPGAGGYYDPADRGGLADVDRRADARGNGDALVRADLRSARDDGRSHSSRVAARRPRTVRSTAARSPSRCPN